MSTLDAIISSPTYQPYLAILKGVRNGLVHGAKLRFPHALIMCFLWGRGDWQSRSRVILGATKQHAFHLAKFAAAYKVFILIQQKANRGKARSSDAFLAGLFTSFIAFPERTPISEQMVLWAISRVVASAIPRVGSVYPYSRPPSAPTGWAAKPISPDSRYFAVLAALSWGAIMWLFEHRGETIHGGAFKSMVYLYRDSEQWKDLKTLLWHN
ncbi:hypothetical protein B0H16DRAFT_1516786, partial [Mycena metata]